MEEEKCKKSYIFSTIHDRQSGCNWGLQSPASIPPWVGLQLFVSIQKVRVRLGNGSGKESNSEKLEKPRRFQRENDDRRLVDDLARKLSGNCVCFIWMEKNLLASNTSPHTESLFVNTQPANDMQTNFSTFLPYPTLTPAAGQFIENVPSQVPYFHFSFVK